MSATLRKSSPAHRSKFKTGVLVVAILLSVCWYYLLFSFFEDNKASSSGELLLGSSGAVEQVKGSPVMAALVDYFGSYLYLVPLILIYLGFAFYKTPLKLKNLDLFKAGLFFLGFDLSAIGICTLLSSAADAGGILGDFFSMYLGTAFSDVVSILIALGASVGGVYLMGGQTLLSATEALGSKICSLFVKDEENEAQSQAKVKDEDNKKGLLLRPVKLKDLIGGKKKGKEESAPQEPEEDEPEGLYDAVTSTFNIKNGYKNEARHEKREPNFGDAAPSAQESTVLPGGLSASDAGTRSEPRFEKEQPYAGEAPHSQDPQSFQESHGPFTQASFGRNQAVVTPHERKDFAQSAAAYQDNQAPAFTEAGSEAPVYPRREQPYSAAPAGAPAAEPGMQDGAALRPGAFVSYSQAQALQNGQALPEQHPSAQQQDGLYQGQGTQEQYAPQQDETPGPRTIIKDSRAGSAPQDQAQTVKPEPEDKGVATHIFRTPDPLPPQSPAPEENEDDEPNAVKTIITHQEAHDKVELPPEDDGVATLITHHVPEPEVKEERKDDNEVHSYIFRQEQPDLIADPEQLDFVPAHQPGGDPNVIDFNDYQGSQQTPSFEVEGSVQGLTPHSAVDNKIYGEDAPLQPHNKFISEKDLPSSYRQATRGVFESDKAPSGESKGRMFETDKASLDEIKKRIEQSISTPADDSMEAQEERLKEGLAAVEREIRAAQENFGGPVKTLGRSTFSRGHAQSKENALSYVKEEQAPAQSAAPAPQRTQSAPVMVQPQTHPAPSTFEGRAAQGLTAVPQSAPAAHQAQAGAQGFAPDQAYAPQPQAQAQTGPVPSGYEMPSSAQGYGPQGTARPVSQGSFENQGFIGGAHNSSASNLPSYINAHEQGATLRVQKFTLSNVTTPLKQEDSWRPSLDLLNTSFEDSTVSADDLERTAQNIDQFLQSFRVPGRVESYVSGPVVTRYDIRLEPGVSSSKISALALDMCRALLVASVRVIEVIPNTPYVGVEVPNSHRKVIYLGNILRSEAFMHSKAALPVMIGVGITGQPLVADLAAAPHLLICGTTGSGKSVGLHSLIVSLIMKLSPQELRLVLIDPKRVEFSLYQDLPHLITPVISDMEKATPALRWCVEEMERRFKLLGLMNVQNIQDYNRAISEAEARGEVVYDPAWSPEMGGTPPVLKRVPMLVIAVEEYADFMLQSKGSKKSDASAEYCINRLASKARAAGIHLILATQTPRSDVITGAIRSNFPSRIAFTVQANVDSRLIIEEGGAEKLLGNGDMLARIQKFQNGQLVRAHGPLVQNHEIMQITQEWRAHYGDPEYIEGVSDIQPEESEPEELQGSGQLDALFDQAAAYARDYFERKHKNPPISDFQATLGVGYPKAKKIYSQLVREGVLSD